MAPDRYLPAQRREIERLAAREAELYEPPSEEFVESLNKYGAEIIDWLVFTPETGYLENYDQLLQSIEADVIRYPDHHHLLAFVGEPDSGKTLIAKQTALLLQRMRGRSQLARSGDMSLLLSELTWGDANPEYNFEGDYHTFSWNRKKKLIETSGREARLQEVLLWYLQQPIEDDSVHIGYFDAPLPTGFFVKGREDPVGIPRGIKLLSSLVKHENDFAGLPYSFHIIGVAASPEVQDKGMVHRVDQMAQNSPEEKMSALLRSGIVPDTDDPELVAGYIDSSAPPDQVIYCRKDTDDVVQFLTAEYVIQNEFGAKINSMNKQAYYRQKRYELMAREILPFFFRKAKVPKDRGIIVMNERVGESVHAYFEIAPDQPLKYVE